jgi:UDP-2,3-diacylglucosamine pyrophosphatase LpxH
MNPLAPRTKVRACFISDLHLGSPDARPRELSAFLQSLDTEVLYLVGDVVDLYWMRRRRLHWGKAESGVLDALRQLAARGTRIIYIPGNHDAAMRRMAGLLLPDLQVRRQKVHRTATGQRLWVTHGDQFDGLIHPGWWLNTLGDGAYRVLMLIERMHRALARWRRRPAWSLAAWLKRQSHTAERHIARFVAAICAETARRGYDGVVCGHIHRAELRQVGAVLYANDGDWVESLSALVELPGGQLQLLLWSGWALQDAVSLALPDTPLHGTADQTLARLLPATPGATQCRADRPAGAALHRTAGP